MIEFDKILAEQRSWQTVALVDDIVAQKMAKEAVSKCGDAIAMLRRNLNDIGYGWTSSERLPSGIVEKNILKIEKTIGLPVPQILVLFWKEVGGVSFVDLQNYQHVDFWREHKVSSPGSYCDGLYVEVCTDGWVSFIRDEFSIWNRESSADESSHFFLALSPDGYHKDNISGGAAYGLQVGLSWMPIWQNFEWRCRARPLTAPAGPLDFLSYLRSTILERAGFPGLSGLPGFNLIRDRLLKGVPLF